MGCGASKQPAARSPGSVAFAAAKPTAPMSPEAQAAAQARTVRLLESLAAEEERVELPVLSNSKRRRSGQRWAGAMPYMLFITPCGWLHF